VLVRARGCAHPARRFGSPACVAPSIRRDEGSPRRDFGRQARRGWL